MLERRVGEVDGEVGRSGYWGVRGVTERCCRLGCERREWRL